jgi:3-oxoacyl-[acyl-carrier protein] reductase
MFSLDLRGTNVWITGGSRGIGNACARAFAQSGANVGFTFIKNESEARNTVDQCEKCGVKAHAVRCDISNQSDCINAFEYLKEKLGDIDVLINNAGIIKDDLFIPSEVDDWNRLFQTNVFGSLYCIQIAAKEMLLNRKGKIVNITSAAGTKGGRGQVLYAATKGALEAATRSLAVELGKKGITVNSIAPGVIETEMSQNIRQIAREEILQRQIIKRFGSPEEVAAWVVMISSSFGDFITGQTFHIDGGLKMN